MAHGWDIEFVTTGTTHSLAGLAGFDQNGFAAGAGELVFHSFIRQPSMLA